MNPRPATSRSASAATANHAHADEAAPLYEQLRDRLFAEILDGTWPDGGFLPTEAELVTRLGMSRVTVRRALQSLKDDGVIASVAGRGTQVTYQNNGHAGALAIITLVADIDNSFFTHFMRRFEPVAEARNALVMLKTGQAGRTFTSDALFEKLIRAGLRDLVLWPLTSDLDPVLYARLRAVGANLVVFDQQLDVPWADTVCLDNTAALAALIDALARKNCRRPVFVDYSDLTTPTAHARRNAFTTCAQEAGMTPTFEGVPFENGQADAADHARRLVDRLSRQATPPDSYVGINGGVGLALAQALCDPKSTPTRPHSGVRTRTRLPVACIDFMPAMAGLGLTVIEQPIDAMAEKVFACLQNQHRKGPRWKAAKHTFQGKLLVT
ncbi:MAG TPA: GntR family transcriptional regulator [Planctomycetota bacterium]|nr:GntR family transcriptional regulator [Planctomycetota bacterium]